MILSIKATTKMVPFCDWQCFIFQASSLCEKWPKINVDCLPICECTEGSVIVFKKSYPILLERLVQCARTEWLKMQMLWIEENCDENDNIDDGENIDDENNCDENDNGDDDNNCDNCRE